MEQNSSKVLVTRVHLRILPDKKTISRMMRAAMHASNKIK